MHWNQYECIHYEKLSLPDFKIVNLGVVNSLMSHFSIEQCFCFILRRLWWEPKVIFSYSIVNKEAFISFQQKSCCIKYLWHLNDDAVWSLEHCSVNLKRVYTGLHRGTWLWLWWQNRLAVLFRYNGPSAGCYTGL